MDTKNIEMKLQYVIGMTDCEINHCPNLDTKNVLEEGVFKDFVRNCCDCNSKFTDEVFELGLSILYAGWLQHD